jgi:hypothetical protein
MGAADRAQVRPSAVIVGSSRPLTCPNISYQAARWGPGRRYGDSGRGGPGGGEGTRRGRGGVRLVPGTGGGT